MRQGSIDLSSLARKLVGAFPRPSPEESRIALSVLHELARGQPAEMLGIAERAGSTPDVVQGTLADWPGLIRDDRGHVVGFCGLGLQPTRHQIELARRTLYAWCAWDALFLGDLLGEDLRVESTCAMAGTPVRLIAGPGGVRDLKPGDAVLSFTDPDFRPPENCSGIPPFCRKILFFSSPSASRAWGGAGAHGTFTLTIDEG